MKQLLVMSLALLTLGGCLKTAEQVKREQRIDNMSQQLSDSQNIVADLTVMLKNLQSQIDTLSGQIEELQQSQKELKAADLKGMSENVNLLKQQVETLQQTQNTQTEELKQQRGFIEKVTEKLGKLNTAAPSPKKNPKDEIAEARKLINRKKWDDAKGILDQLIGNNAIPASDMNKGLFCLGEVEYGKKKWEKSLGFLSKIYTKYPKSSLAAPSLLHIGRALEKLGKKDEAAQAFQELRSQYPGSAAAKEVR